MVSGYEAVRQFSDTNAVMLDYTDLYPQRNIILSGVKAINESKMKFALEAGAAVTFAVKGPMTHIFETIIQNRRNMLPQVDSVTYDDKKGLAGWIGTQRILLGNRDLLAKHNINVPDAVISAEKKYRDMGSEVTYISISGELVAMFIMTYKVERSINDIPGAAAHVDHKKNSARVEMDREVPDDIISSAVESIGYKVTAIRSIG